METIEGLALDDLQDEYCQLLRRYQALQDTHESDTQRIHELKRCLDTAVAAETYLSQELEQLTAPNEAQNALHKAQADLEEMRRKHTALQATHSTLQQEYDSVCDENSTLRSQMKTMSAAAVDTAPQPEATTKDHYERLALLEQENMELLQKLEEFHEKIIQHTMAMAEKERNIEILRDQVNCLEENMRSKRDELEEKTQLLDSAQEQLAEANAQIAMLKSAPESNDRKGNSLFAEVDDQRQAMKQLLAAQKQSYLQMKKIFNESEHEIRRLKRENVAMQTELQACSAIFCNADKTYQEKLNERIRNLSNANEELERKLKWTQDQLKELADGKGVQWLESMFNFCKQETDDFKKQLHSVRIQKASLEEQLRHVQQDMARWRFESLKSRCVLLDRENLLNENNIKFKPVRDVEFKMDTAKIEKARPRIVSANKDQKIDNTVKDVKIEEHADGSKTVGNNNNESGTEPNNSKADIRIDEVKVELKENTSQETPSVPVAFREDDANNVYTSPSSTPIKSEHISPAKVTASLHDEMKSLSIKHFASESLIYTEQQQQQLPNKVVPSILTKPRDIFDASAPSKHVKFSTEAASVHTLSPDHLIPMSPTVVNPNIKAEGDDEEDKENNIRPNPLNPLVRRMKSNVVVHRFVVNSNKMHMK